MMSMLSSLYHCMRGPMLKRLYRTEQEQGHVYRANLLEHYAQLYVSFVDTVVVFVPYLSPVILIALYRRGLPTPGVCLSGFVLLSVLYGVALTFRGIGRWLNKDYLTFLTIYQACRVSPSCENKAFLQKYDFDFRAWPADYYWQAEIANEKIRPRLPLNSSRTAFDFSSPFSAWLKSAFAYVAAHSFGRRLMYPGSLSLFQFILRQQLDEGRRKLIEVNGGQRIKLVTENKLEIETVLVDRRSASRVGANGNCLVIVCEGNAGFLEIGCMNTPIEAGFSVLGFNHPGFGGSTGVPWPENEEKAIDVIMQYAINSLGFREDQIVLYGWSIGGYPAIWAAIHYARVGGLFLDATFDDVLPLAFRAMGKSLHPIVEQTIRTYLNLNIAQLFEQYSGAFLLLRRSQDEIIITDDRSHELRRRSNRANFLLKKILHFRFPMLVPLIQADYAAAQNSDDVELLALLERWLDLSDAKRGALLAEYDVDAKQCAVAMSSALNAKRSAADGNVESNANEASALFPWNIGEGESLDRRKQLLLFILSKHFLDFNSTHCTPLPASYFRIPSAPWDG